MKSLTSLSELFQNKIFRIPDYQRGYAWQDEQLNDFWDDIINLPKGHSHYTGMISLKELTADEVDKWEDDDKWIITTKKYKAYHVVDGQQRLTTFIILLKSIINFARENGHDYLLEDAIDAIISKYFFEANKNGVLRAYKFGYEKDNPSFEFLKYEILEDKSPRMLEKTFYTFNLLHAKSFFDQRILEISSIGFDKIEEIFSKLTTSIHFNIYEIETDFDVNVAFETMNNRGKKLSNLEILKNRLIYLTTIYDDSILAENEKQSIRKKINEAWKEVYKQLGRKDSSPLPDDEYLRNHWIMYFKYSRRRGDDYIKYLLQGRFTVRAVQGKEREILLFDEIHDSEYENLTTEVIKDDSVLHYREIEKYVASLSELSQFWFYSYNPEFAKEAGFSEDEIKWLIRLNRVGIANFRPLVVASLKNRNISAEQRVRLYKAIEKCIFVWFRMASFNNSLYSVDAYNYSRFLLENDDVDSITVFFEEKFSEYYQAAKEAFITRIKNFFVKDGYFDWQDLRYFLYEYEDWLFSKSHRKDLLPAEWRSAVKGYYSIEHIYPQTATDWYWTNEFRDYTEEEKSVCIKTIGNMLLLSRDINSSLQNYSYPRKCNPISGERTGYANGSFSEREVYDNFKDWNPSTIYERGKKLLGFFKTRWNVDFTASEKESLSGMQFIRNVRVVSNSTYNPNTIVERIQVAFNSNGYVLSIKKNFIQIMKSNWIFEENISGSIHYEVFTQDRTAFDALLGKKSKIMLAFHTEAGCPEYLRKGFRSLRKEIGEIELVDNFLTIEQINISIETLVSKLKTILDKYNVLIDKTIDEAIIAPIRVKENK